MKILRRSVQAVGVLFALVFGLVAGTSLRAQADTKGYQFWTWLNATEMDFGWMGNGSANGTLGFYTTDASGTRQKFLSIDLNGLHLGSTAHLLDGGISPYLRNTIVIGPATQTLGRSDAFVTCNDAGGSVTLTLPAADTVGELVSIVKTSNVNSCTVNRAGSDTIDTAATSIVLGAFAGQKLSLISDALGHWWSFGTPASVTGVPPMPTAYQCTWDIPSTAAGATSNNNCTGLTGVTTHSVCTANQQAVESSFLGNLIAQNTGGGQVTLRWNNLSGAAEDPASSTFDILCFNY